MNTNPPVVIVNNTDLWDIPIDITHNALKVIKYLQITADHIEITLLNEDGISSLNQQYFNTPAPTDTITLNMGSDAVITADIYICPPVVIANAKTFNTPVANEFNLVLIHSLLHACGHQDNTPEEFNEMSVIQEKIRTELNL